MEFLDLAKARCSIRSFQEKPVEDDAIDSILEAARVAPSACNMQPVRLIVVKDEEGLAKVGKAANIYGAPLAIIVCADHTKAWRRSYDGKSSSDIDASIVCDHMMLEAADLGLGSVWICAFDPKALRRDFGIPETGEPVNLLAIGYPAGDVKSPSRHDAERVPLAEMVSYGSW